MKMTTADLTPDPSWRTAADVTLQTYCGTPSRDKTPCTIRVWARGLNGTDRALVNFMDKDGHTVAATIPLTDRMQMVEADPSTLTPAPAVVLPQDWPEVCSYYYPQSLQPADTLDWSAIEFVQVSLRDTLYPRDNLKNKGIQIQQIILEY